MVCTSTVDAAYGTLGGSLVGQRLYRDVQYFGHLFEEWQTEQGTFAALYLVHPLTERPTR